MKRFESSVNIIPFLALRYIVMAIMILSLVLSIFTIFLAINNTELKNDLSDCQNELSQIHITNLDLADKNKKLETELISSKSKIEMFERNSEIQSKMIAEYKAIIDRYEETDIPQKNVNTINKWEIGQEVPLPSIPSNMKLCTDYRFYNIKGTPHNRLQLSAWTDEFGCRRYNDDYIVGLGSFYSVDIGDRFEVTLDTGRVFTIILGDGKADCDTDELNMFTPCFNYEGEYCANILEFIIDKDVMYDKCYQYGSLDYHDEFKGNIVKMVYLGRDNGGDWTTYE